MPVKTNEVEIVVVEDSPSDIELLMRVFNKHSIVNSIVFLKDGEEALDYFDQLKRNGNAHQPKMILLDLKIPKVNGIEVLRRLKADKHTKDIPIITLTGSQEDRDLRDCNNAGVVDYIIKPLTFNDFAKIASQLGCKWVLVND